MYKLNLLLLKLVAKYPKLNKIFKPSFGLIPEEVKETDYTLGVSPLSKKILQPNGDWTGFLPQDERQSGRSIETMACVTFSFLNVIEALFKRKYNLEVNFSDRFLAKASGTGANGNLQSRVADTARKIGLINESDYPSNIDDFSWDEFYKPLTQNLFDKAKGFLNEYEIGYEALSPTLAEMKEGLKYSPLWVAGSAWYRNGEFYVSFGNPNHCFVIYNIEQAIAYRKALDTYEPFRKTLASNFQVYYPKIITLNKKGEAFNFAEIVNLIRRGLKYVMRVQGAGEIYELSETEGLKYISPEEWNNIAVQLSAEQKKLVGISDEFYQKLLV